MRFKDLMAPLAICDALAGKHVKGKIHSNCKHAFQLGGFTYNCCHNLYDSDLQTAYNKLRDARAKFLAPSYGTKARGRDIMNALTLPTLSAGDQAATADEDMIYAVRAPPPLPCPPLPSPPLPLATHGVAWLQVGRRRVCKDIFHLRYPVSRATLDRLIAAKRCGFDPYGGEGRQSGVLTDKSMYAVAWWLNYAEQTAERLPDQGPALMTPRRHLASTLPHCLRPPLSPVPCL